MAKYIFLIQFWGWIAAVSTDSFAMDTVNLSTEHQIGVAVGGSAIGGLIYRKFFENRLGVQTSLMAYPSFRSWDIICGTHLFYALNRRSGKTRYYAFVGVSAILESFKQITLLPGPGIGMEIALNRNFLLAIELFLAPIINIGRPQTLPVYIPIPLLGFLATYRFH